MRPILRAMITILSMIGTTIDPKQWLMRPTTAATGQSLNWLLEHAGCLLGCAVKRWIHNLREFVIDGGRDESPLRFDVWVLFRTSLRCPPTTRNSIRTLPNLLPLSSVARRGTSHHAVGNKNV